MDARSMRVRRFDTRTNMTQTLQGLGLITDEDALRIDKLTFEDSCPLFSAEIDEDTLAAHGFLPPES
jgi:hypothetical protein